MQPKRLKYIYSRIDGKETIRGEDTWYQNGKSPLPPAGVTEKVRAPLAGIVPSVNASRGI